MKRIIGALLFAALVLGFAAPGYAQDRTYRIEVLQIVALAPFQDAYEGFVKELEKNGLVQGKNHNINRTIVDFDLEKAGLWQKVGLLRRIKSEASRIADARPDLAFTIGTPATKYAKDKIISSGIPLVFTGVAFPQSAGCRSLTEGAPGLTGSTVYMNVKDALSIVKLAFPSAGTIGVVHSDDETAMQHTEEIKREAPGMGFSVTAKQVGKNDHLSPAAQELIDKGAEVFIVPLDAYYGMRNNEAWNELDEITRTRKIPAVSFVYHKSPGAILYLGSDYGLVGGLAGQHAAAILKDGSKPESLPILRQEDLNIMADVEKIKKLNIDIPLEILQLAKPVQ